MQNSVEENKKIAKYIAPILGVNPKARRFWDDGKNNHLDVFFVDDPIDEAITFSGTLGVSDFKNLIETKEGNKTNIPVELLMAGYKKYEKIPEILSTCGFFIIKDNWEAQPGSVFMRVFSMYYPNKDMEHIIFTTPFLWQNRLQPLKLEAKTVHWLLAIPISQSELEYRNENGFTALEKLFEEKEIDLFDLDRKSVL